MYPLHRRYTPLPAQPMATACYGEAPAAEPLRPYIRCFWFQKPGPAFLRPAFFIPDTCADLIFTLNALTGKAACRFLSPWDRPGLPAPVQARTFTFGIRFYAWSLGMFTQESIRKNETADGWAFFPQLAGDMARALRRSADFSLLIQAAQPLLLTLKDQGRMRADVWNAVAQMVAHPGQAALSDLARGCAVSTRQLQRLFLESTGLTPMKIASLIRYQQVWRRLAADPRCSLAKLAADYFYTDQAHLTRDFSKYHGMPPRKAADMLQSALSG